MIAIVGELDPAFAGMTAEFLRAGKRESRGTESLWQELKGMCPFLWMPEGLP